VSLVYSVEVSVYDAVLELFSSAVMLCYLSQVRR